LLTVLPTPPFIYSPVWYKLINIFCHIFFQQMIYMYTAFASSTFLIAFIDLFFVCGNHISSYMYQAGELSENSLISEIFVSTSEKIRQVFLLNAYKCFQRFFNLPIEFSEIVSTLCSPPWYTKCRTNTVVVIVTLAHAMMSESLKVNVRHFWELTT
jgi:glucan phosphoethanolaminetransferase (alkaline phosphatase superfamily)